MSVAAAGKLFVNYTKMPRRIPLAVWVALRTLVLAGTIGLAVVLTLWPEIGLRLFWGLAIPVLPGVFALAPGVWRQVCPMATLNQMPRQGGFTQGRDLPEQAKTWAFAIAVAFFFGTIALRAPLLNASPALVAIGIVLVLALAFLGGLVFKGRSGWCGTFCPLGPIQRDYGHAPLAVVRNGFCDTCLGCQKNCYDFNPRAAVFSDLYDEDPRYSGQRRFFMAMMPGVILGYFLQDQAPAYGPWVQFAILVGTTMGSVGLYQMLTGFLGLNLFRTANLFAAAALALFYVFSGPTIVKTLSALADVAVPQALIDASRATGLVIAGLVIYQGWRNEYAYEEMARAANHLQVDQSGHSLRERLATAGAAQVLEKSSGTSFSVAPNQTLLDAMEAARIKINFGCRSGLCGADAVAIHEGSGNLSPPGEDETATLRRLGLEGKARLACMCQVRGPVTVDTNLQKAAASAVMASDTEDRAAALGIRHVVIIGNGVAGLGVAEALRRKSASVEITVITGESHHFYNRMAIGRVIYGRSAMDGLHLLPDAWYKDNRVDVWRNTIATAVDREARQLHLGTGETLPYDRLVLATGAHAASPGPEYSRYTNAFVLRAASDAEAVRAFAQARRARRAVVIGGGVLGVEAADALHHLGLDVVLLQRSGRLMDRQLDSTGAVRLTQYLNNIGIEVVHNAVVASFSGETELEQIALSDGTIITGDLFIACVGIVPNIELAKSCGLATGRGIVVDAHMATADPAIFAVGDVAELPGAPGGLWPVGAAQATAVVSTMLGAPQAYEVPRLLVQLKCDGIDLRSYGMLEAQAGDEVISAPPAETAWWSFILRDREVTGAVFVGPPGSGRVFTRALQARCDLTPVLPDLREGRLEALARVL
ncbi:FAD-dependent oxidoreductase [Methylovirgula sp. 4M-Z18]|uniref:FAD-dependent oxidoreductase n=1 Tax=Methylovirgula sp. 4M-Z18 TaxID=2293567 RepID=UPI000E2FA211|nr:FAD-dependent oxidoreductase [Methylovirgula sp. 4M-Z18]RFB78602.1 hypothetical protein DYH55_15445 [Methylovirgula sp. 4M-Z18]